MKGSLVYHGIVIAQGFRDPTFPKSFPLFAKRVSHSEGWIIYGIEVKAPDLEDAIAHTRATPHLTSLC